MPNMTFCRIKVIKGRQYAYLVKSYRDKTTGKKQIYPPLMAGYTFNGKAPQPPVCIHADEYQNWLSKMRAGVTVETLGTMVARWITEPCPNGVTTPKP